LAIHNRATNYPSAIRDGGLSNPSRDLPKVSDTASDFTVHAPHDGVRGVTEPRRSLGNRIERRLQISRGAGDHPQDIASGSELFE
jgi:hypothetical protein